MIGLRVFGLRKGDDLPVLVARGSESGDPSESGQILTGVLSSPCGKTHCRNAMPPNRRSISPMSEMCLNRLGASLGKRSVMTAA